MFRFGPGRPWLLGRRFEWEIFNRDLSFWTEIPPRISFLSSIIQVVNKQPDNWNPLSPHTLKGQELLYLTRGYLAGEMARYYSDPEIIEEITKNTGLYDALGTPADFWWGTDAVVYCDFGWGFVNNPKITIDFKAGPDDGPETLRDKHFIVTRDHFIKLGANGKKCIDNLAWVMADALATQVKTMAHKEWARTTQIEERVCVAQAS